MECSIDSFNFFHIFHNRFPASLHSNVGFFAALISRVVQPCCTRCTMQQMHSASLCWVSHRHRIVKVHAADLSEQRNWLTSGSRMLHWRICNTAWTIKTLLISHKPLWICVSAQYVWNIDVVYFMFIQCSLYFQVAHILCTRKHRGPRAIHRHRRSCFSKTA